MCILSGKPLGQDGNSVVHLSSGLNFVGLPLRDPKITRVSDLFMFDKPGNNTFVIILIADGEMESVARVNDPGDIEIVGGQSFIIITQQDITIDLHGEGWQRRINQQ